MVIYGTEKKRSGGNRAGNFDQTLPLGDRFGFLTCTEGGYLSTWDLGLMSHPNDGAALGLVLSLRPVQLG